MSDSGMNNPFVARRSADSFAELERAKRGSGADSSSASMAPTTRARFEKYRMSLGIDAIDRDNRVIDMDNDIVIDEHDKIKVKRQTTSYVETNTAMPDDSGNTGSGDVFGYYEDTGFDFYERFAQEEKTNESVNTMTYHDTDETAVVSSDNLPSEVRIAVAAYMKLSRVGKVLTQGYLGLVPRSELRKEVNRITAMAVADARESHMAQADEAVHDKIAELSTQLSQAHTEIHRLKRDLLDQREASVGHSQAEAAFGTTRTTQDVMTANAVSQSDDIPQEDTTADVEDVVIDKAADSINESAPIESVEDNDVIGDDEDLEDVDEDADADIPDDLFGVEDVIEPDIDEAVLAEQEAQAQRDAELAEIPDTADDIEEIPDN